MAKTNFIGYATLEFLVDLMEKGKPVYISATLRTEKADEHGLCVYRASIIVEQPDECGDVNYVAMLAGKYLGISGAPEFDAEGKEKVVKRQMKMLELVRGWLTAAGFTLREARIDRPENLSMMYGWLEALKYDRGSDTFSLEGSHTIGQTHGSAPTVDSAANRD
jgi:hypothetical protein